MSRLLIGIAGSRPGIGKSYVSEIFYEMMSGSLDRFNTPMPRIIPIALPIKRAAHSLITTCLGDTSEAVALADEYIYWTSKDVIIPELGVTGRQLMKMIGHTMGRENISTDVWVNAYELHILSQPNVSFICDDIRYPNEADMIKRNGGHLIYVHDDTAPDLFKEDPTENNLLTYNFDYTLNNDGERCLMTDVRNIVHDIEGF